MKEKRVPYTNILPICTLFVVSIVFGLISKGKTLSPNNMLSVVDQSFTVMIGGMGMIFVLCHGGIDLAIGSTACLSAFVASRMAMNYGIIVMILVAMCVGVVVGIIAGTVVAVFKVPSFMVTVALQTGIRGIANYLAATSGIVIAPPEVQKFNNMSIKVPVVIAMLIITGYVFEYTRVGLYSKAVGENELCCKISGVNVIKVKIIDFAISGAMSGMTGIFYLARTGGMSNMIGKGLEMKVILALLLGGVPVVGGMDSKMFKVVLGSLTVIMLENGLSVAGITGGLYQLIEGIMLVIVCVLTTILKRRSALHDEKMMLEVNKAL